MAVSEVFATATNHPAVQTYRRAGYPLVDHGFVAFLGPSDVNTAKVKSLNQFAIVELATWTWL